ncbi:MmcQ/YjbR family DNA-binding protein [Umezawaea endophytica]|uniref:MmcQ/YjbR family DNA-binding protein n=1 Tax=Umezawaea endophytica TaxID=1654476 RepID=A0A9X2VQV0_9PSEU|nr:MmcQ/YjbR family DNA-binding protein [Umezawaea endophytica]MCS7480624.1 MmcQ/YjbR family DNA-binding protein [Umezawaea endophytica]
MVDYGDVPAPVVARLRSLCLGLPDAYEERAWRGTRWMVRKRTFAHVLTVEPEHPAAYARAAGATGAIVVMTFRAPGSELDALVGSGHPFFKAGWGTDVVGLVLTDDVDWTEVGELLTDSYCVLAPKKLVALVDRPG